MLARNDAASAVSTVPLARTTTTTPGRHGSGGPSPRCSPRRFRPVRATQDSTNSCGQEAATSARSFFAARRKPRSATSPPEVERRLAALLLDLSGIALGPFGFERVGVDLAQADGHHRVRPRRSIELSGRLRESFRVGLAPAGLSEVSPQQAPCILWMDRQRSFEIRRRGTSRPWTASAVEENGSRRGRKRWKRGAAGVGNASRDRRAT